MAKQLDLPHHYRQHLETLLRRHLPTVEVWAYGSRVNGQSHDSSDLDLVLRSPDLQPIPANSLASFSEALRASTIPFLVEAHDWARLPESFHPEIEREHLVLVAADSKPLDKRCSGMKDEWQELRWGDLATLEYGRALRGHNSRTGPVRVFGTNGPIGWHDEALCSYPSVVIGRKGAYRGVHYSAEPFFVIDTAFYLKPKVELDTRWAYYQLLTQDINGLDSGSAIPSTRREDFYNLPVQVPPLPEQRTIAQILGTLDDKIELNRRLNETLEELARAIFKDWFVDFGPVRAKLEGRDTGLPEHLAELFPDRLVESELGEIPEGWGVKALDEIAAFQNGLALQKYRPQGDEEWLPVVKIADLKRGRVKGDEKATANIRPECIIDDGDVVFSWSGSLTVKIWCGGRAALNQHLFKVTSTKFPKWFFLHCIHSHLRDFQDIAAGKATTMGHIKRHHLSEAMCAIPDERLLAAANFPLSTLLERGIAANIQSRTLAALRDTLLPKLVSGEVRVGVGGS